MTFHSKASLGARHPIHNWEYADASARTGASGFTSDDLGKVARQLDNDSYWVLTDTGPTWADISSGGGSGETNTASNVGTGGVGLFKTKVGVDLQFKKINAGSSKITISDDTGNDEVDVDVSPGNISHQDLSGAGTNDHAALDSHVGDTANPHGTDIGNLGNGSLAELNSKITDATLDDSSDQRSADQLQGRALVATAPTDGQVMTWDAGNSQWEPADPPGAGSGEANTASNQGVGGVSVFDSKVGVDLQFKSINSGSSKLSVTDDPANKEVDLDVVPGNISHQDLNGAGTNDHAAIDSHVASTTNPHATDIGNLGTGSLTELNSKVTDATLDDASDPRDPNAHASTHQDGGSDEISVAGLSGVLASRQDADKLQGRDVQDAAPNDGDVLVWDDGNSRWQPEAQGASASVFGLDYQTVVSAPRSTTTSNTFQAKVTLTTPALTGTYRVGWQALLDHDSASQKAEARLYNTTNAAIIGGTHIHEPKDSDNRIGVGGFAEVVFTGAAKSFQVQYRAQSSGTSGIQDARIEIWRVA